MRHVQHPIFAPSALTRAINNGATNWGNFSGKDDVREELYFLQKGLCAYCQIRLDGDIGCHIEHVWPKHAHPEKTFDWRNLVLSCTHSEHISLARQTGGVSCGHSDGKRAWPIYNPMFISPMEPDCERYFEYRADDGTVIPAKDLSEHEVDRARYTIDLLNLNCRRLCRERKDMLEQGYRIIAELRADTDSLKHFLECEVAEVGGKLRAFFTASRQHFQVFA